MTTPKPALPRRLITVTLTEREVRALHAAIALWTAEYEIPDDYPGTLTERRATGDALDRVNCKLWARS